MESSTDGGVTWVPIVNVTTTQPYTALVTSTRYRANVQSGACAAAITNTVTITVNPNSRRFSCTSSDNSLLCTNGGTLTLSGHTGTITRWEFSTNGGVSWTNVANTTTTLNYTNLVATRMYRALVKSGVCANVYSATATVTVVVAVGGTVSSSATVCSGANAGTLTLSGEAGTILNWNFQLMVARATLQLLIPQIQRIM